MVRSWNSIMCCITVYPKKYAHGFVVLCFVVVMQSFIMNSHEVFIHIHQGCFAGTGAIVRLPQCQWCKPGGYGKISQCIATTKHTKTKTVCIFLGIYCIFICLTHCGQVTPYGWYGSGSTLAQVMACCLMAPFKLPEPTLTDQQWSPVTFILGQFHKRCRNHQSLQSIWKFNVKNLIKISQGPMS